MLNFQFQEPSGTLWLSICNLALGVGVVVGLLAVFCSAARSAFHRHTTHVQPARH